MKKKIVVDLDVTTLAFWDKKDEAKLIERVKSGMFSMVTPYIILEHLSKWSYRKLADEIASFYEIYSSQIISAQNILDKINEIHADFKKLFAELVHIGVKEEDIILVIVSGIPRNSFGISGPRKSLIFSGFNVDYLVTFNRKHLKNNEAKINEVLTKNGVKTIRIIVPKEL